MAMIAMNTAVKLQVLDGVLTYYQLVVSLNKHLYGAIVKLKSEPRKAILHSAMAYLSRDLMTIEDSVENIMLQSNISIRNRQMVADILKGIGSLASYLLRPSPYGGMENKVNSLIAAINFVSRKVYDLFKIIILNTNEFDVMEYQLLEIIYECGYVFEKFVILITMRLKFENLFPYYTGMLNNIFSLLRSTLKQFEDEKFIDDFIGFTKCALKCYKKYQRYLQKIFTPENTSTGIQILLNTISTYVEYHVLVFTEIINAETPIDNMLGALDEVRSKLLETNTAIIDILKSRTPENDKEEQQMMYHSCSFFVETTQNLLIISEIGTLFRFSDF